MSIITPPPPFVLSEGHWTSSESAKGKEAWAWETKNRIPGYRPENHPYPKTMYRAYTGDDGIVRGYGEPEPEYRPTMTQDLHQRLVNQVNAFNAKCLANANDPEHEKALYADGWRETAKEAYDRQKGYHLEIMEAAAHQNFLDRRMSPAAKAEKAAFDALTPLPVSDLPEARTVKTTKVDGRSKAAKAAKAAEA